LGIWTPGCLPGAAKAHPKKSAPPPNPHPNAKTPPRQRRRFQFPTANRKALSTMKIDPSNHNYNRLYAFTTPLALRRVRFPYRRRLGRRGAVLPCYGRAR
jgi:hypothetical protein